MLKRIMAYVLNILILVIPLTVLYLYLGEQLFNWKLEGESGVAIFGVIIQLLCPQYILILIIDGSKFIQLTVPLSTLMEVIVVETVLTFIFQGDLAKRILDLKIVSNNGKRVTLIQVLVRTIIKYLSISFIPALLIYPFLSKTNKTFHDVIAKTKVIDL